MIWGVVRTRKGTVTKKVEYLARYKNMFNENLKSHLSAKIV